MSRDYTSTRPRGLASWNPHKSTRELLGQVQSVLDEYADQLPLTARQIFYRLVGAYGYEKTENASDRLGDKLVRARRAGMIPFEAIRDDGTTERAPAGFHGLPDFWETVAHEAKRYRRDRLADQPTYVEIWVEAAGMVPQVARVAEFYGVPVFSSGGFDSLTAKWEAARRMIDDGRPTVVLHVGDHDPSGWSVFDSAAEDVAALVDDMGGVEPPTFRRVAVIPDQIDRYGLPSAPAKSTDNRGDWTGGTVQAEALTPVQLADEIRTAVESVVDLDVLQRTLDVEAEERAALLEELP